MTLNFAQVFGDDYQTADLPAYPLLSININNNSWETFTSDGEEFVLRRLNEIVSNPMDEGLEDGDEVRVYREWNESNNGLEELYEWTFNEKEWEEPLSKDMDEIVKEEEEKEIHYYKYWVNSGDGNLHILHIPINEDDGVDMEEFIGNYIEENDLNLNMEEWGHMDGEIIEHPKLKPKKEKEYVCDDCENDNGCDDEDCKNYSIGRFDDCDCETIECPYCNPKYDTGSDDEEEDELD